MTLTINSDRTIPAGETDSFSDQNGIDLNQIGMPHPPALTINGQVVVTASTNVRVFGILANTSSDHSTIHIGAGGSVTVTSTANGGSADGIFEGSWGPTS